MWNESRLVSSSLRSNPKSSYARIAIAAASAVLVVSGVAQAELLTNGNFNSDSITPGTPDNWTSWMYGTSAFAAFKNDAPNDPFDFDGSGYVNAGNYGEWWSSGGGWYQQVAGTGGTPYTFSAFCATEGWDNAAGELRIIYFDDIGTELQRDVRHSAEYQANLPWSPFVTTSVAPAAAVSVKVELATWGARGAVLWDETSLNTASIWTVDADGDAADLGNWLGGAPGGVDSAARFLGAITTGRTVAVDAPLTLGSISFANTNSYVLAGTSTLRLETSAGYSIVDVQSGTQRIGVPTTLASNTYLAVAGGATLEVGGPLTVAAGKSLKPSGAGTITYQSSVTLEAGASIVIAADANLTALSLASTATVSLPAHGAAPAKTLTVNSLDAAADSKIDVADNTLVVNYSTTSPVATVRSLLSSAFNSGAWDGPGITSSSVSAGMGLGYSDSGSSLTVTLAKLGDATLNGVVDFDDLLLLAQNYGSSSGATWGSGDFNYTAGVEFDDLLALAQNYGVAPALTDLSGLSESFVSDWTLAQSMVPEPTALAALAMLGALGRRRRP